MTRLRVRLAAAAILGATFVGGLALGVALDRGAALPRPSGSALADADRGEPSPPPNDWIIDRLDLGAEQQAAVDSVLAHFGAHMSGLQREYRPQFQAMVDSANRALRVVLTEAQLATYDSLEAELRRRRMRGNPEGRR